MAVVEPVVDEVELGPGRAVERDRAVALDRAAVARPRVAAEVEVQLGAVLVGQREVGQVRVAWLRDRTLC